MRVTKTVYPEILQLLPSRYFSSFGATTSNSLTSSALAPAFPRRGLVNMVFPNILKYQPRHGKEGPRCQPRMASRAQDLLDARRESIRSSVVELSTHVPGQA